ncbi:MAG: dephospho-CoA kinase [Proteobacteria bacterium]|nr:MAG: dephospho-CoA kinase [Pseudomonadota bacterium]
MTRAIALTGGIGSGKSTVAKMFADMEIPVLDLDAVGRELLDSPKVQAALMHAFGTDIQTSQGHIDRKTLAARAFCDADKTARLNAILHPEIAAYEQQWLKKQHASYVIIEASVLLESGGVSRMDGLIVVLADQSVRKKRVLMRGKQNEAMFNQIIERQCDDNMRHKHADYILHNDGSLQALQQQVVQLSEQLSKESS